MRLSAPIFILKQQAKSLSRKSKIPLHKALDQIAHREGFSTWSLLCSKVAAQDPATTLLEQLHPGDLVLLAARPGQGKTLLALGLAIKSIRQGNQAAFFTLDFTLADVDDRLQHVGENRSHYADRFLVDDSDEICADYIIARLVSARAKTLVVIDYLQLLDQRRNTPTLMHQVKRLKAFARAQRVIILCLSQIDRSYDRSGRPCPDMNDVRLPNPLDLRLFNAACFLNQGKMRMTAAT